MSIAIISLACRYPDAPSPEALWANVLDGRRAFRNIPAERLDLLQYAVDRVGVADSITPIKAGLISDWHFDCARFRIPQQTFQAADLTHWLALDVAAEAVSRAGGVDGFDRSRTAVVVANTLTGEFSRAALLRLRAPFLDDVLAEALKDAGVPERQGDDLRGRFAAALRGCFPAPQEDSLAGGLANTIAGRIANYFDFHGGAYSVDAACASSLVAIADAAELLVRGDADVAVVGAVDLSLDPFELVGFARNGALAADEMRVFDQRSSGFWPGEGAGFAVLVRAEEAHRRKLPVLAVLRGWGISTDGAGGFTRPSVEGQLLALQRSYARAGADPGDLGYVEAHGTGTAVGDPVEIRALAALRGDAGRALPIGSVKANIGHTKAAAGFAGLIKAVAALRTRIVPPHVGCAIPHPAFADTGDRIRPALAPEPWSDHAAALAGVSAFGFGGINAHVVLEGWAALPDIIVLPAPPRPQDCELFVFGGEAEHVLAAIRTLMSRASSLSFAEIVDAAAQAARNIRPGPARAAVVAAEPEGLLQALQRAHGAIEAGREILVLDDGFRSGRRICRHERKGISNRISVSRPGGSVQGRWRSLGAPFRSSTGSTRRCAEGDRRHRHGRRPARNHHSISCSIPSAAHL